ncbi:OPT oligopeptide transporter protein-domain-containing protein [Mucor mucedo]|uniref:OPT oligopeptide transporter protein-domain-containing protein n=1 Tax=Mucor mucedo TaxID=29922 RepID=UPI002220F4D3|nr:OPT oligopeptide transporter protein-domain-containing protein [Mucor mucedo]KAI7891754.1 OPT oligopeptide transporter protein-domain-containing protein [Mucor mucedo]
MCFSNMYFGLQTGWISMMSLQASLLGFAIFRPFQNRLACQFGPIENVYLQTVAVATATMPLAAGFVGIIPALGQLTASDNPSGPIILSAWKLMLWSLGLSFFGVFFAIPLRKQTIIKEQLKFPSGTATAQMITLLHDIPEPQLRQRTGLNRIQLQQQQEAHELTSVSEDTSTNLSVNENLVTVDEQPSDIAWSLKLHALLVSFSLSSAYTLTSYFFPIIYALPVFNWITFNYIDFKAWEWYFTPSLSYIGQGIIMGLPTTLSMLLGAFVGWGILSPLAYFSGWAPGPINDWKTGSKGWILWVSLGVMISESIVSLATVLVKQAFLMIRSERSVDTDQQEGLLGEFQNDEGWGDDGNETPSLPAIHSKNDLPTHQQVPFYMTVTGLIASVILCIVMVKIVFGSEVMPIGMTVISIVFAMFLSVLGVRALGETDLNPVSGIGKISQILAGGLMPGAIVANLIAGGIAEAGAQQAGDLMQDLKTGYLLDASPKAQFYGQLIGSLFSSFVSTGAYLLYTSVYVIPGPEFPVPTAQVWLDMSRLVNGQPLPDHVLEFILGFAILFAFLVVIKETGGSDKGWRRYIPQGIAFAIGIYNPPSFTLARVIGGFIASAWESYCDSDRHSSGWCKSYKKIGHVLIVIVASGFVLGEGTFAIVNMALHVLRVPHF